MTGVGEEVPPPNPGRSEERSDEESLRGVAEAVRGGAVLFGVVFARFKEIHRYALNDQR